MLALALSLITLPIWYYLLYSILDAIDANELQWFLFWVYIPLGVIIKVISDLTPKESSNG